MTWTEPETALAETPMVQFRFGSLTEETDYDYEVSLDPTFSEGVFGGQFRTSAAVNNVDLATFTIRGDTLDLSGFDLSVDYDIPVQYVAVRGTNAVTATAADPNATVAVDPEMVEIDAVGTYQFTVTVTNGTSQRVYTLLVVVNALTTLGDIDPVTESPEGVWSNGVRVWVTRGSTVNRVLYAYDLYTGAAVPGENITVPIDAAVNNALFGLTSDGTHMYLYVQRAGGDLNIYEFAPGADAVTPILNIFSSFGHVFDVHYSDDTLWYLFEAGTSLRVLRRNNGVWLRDPTREFALSPPLPPNRMGRGIWGNETHLWIVNGPDRHVYAFTHDGERVESLEWDLATENGSPRGMWSDGFVALIADRVGEKLFAYEMTTGTHIGVIADQITPPMPTTATLYVVDNGGELWSCDPTNPGDATKVGDFPAGLQVPQGVTAIGNTLYIIDNTGDELWSCDPANPGAATEVGDFPAGLDSPFAITAVGNTLYIIENPFPHGAEELWSCDPTNPAGATKVGDFPNGLTDPNGMAAVGGTLYIVNNIGNELWSCDPSDPGAATKVGDFPAALTGPNGITAVGNTLYIADLGTPDELWSCDPADPGDAMEVGDFPDLLSDASGITAIST